MLLSNKSQAMVKVNVYNCRTVGSGITGAQKDGIAPRQGCTYDI